MAHSVEEELDHIARIVGGLPAGASLSQILARLLPSLPEYTVQRRLAKLVEQKRIRREGTRRGARYYPLSAQSAAAVAAHRVGRPGDIIPLSNEASVLKAYVRQPLGARKPVGYDHAFLDRYRPNESYYLPEPLRTRLHELGNVSSGNRPAGTYARQIFQRLLIDLSWNSSRLEGNTYSLLETEKLLEIGKGPEGKAALEAQMLLNHKEAIEFLVDSADIIAFNKYTVMNLHALLAKNLLGNSAAEGRLRSIEEYFIQILDTAQAIRDPFEQAFFAMVHIPYLQPFEDGNKRVSRLAANIPFFRKNLCPLSFVDLPEDEYLDGLLSVYERNDVALLRDVFAWAYERSTARYAAVRHTLGNPDPFRMKYHAEIFEMVSEAVRNGLSKSEAPKAIRLQGLSKIPEEERARFVDVVENELLNLHIGNIARYRIRPSEFEQWQKKWTS